MVVETTPRISIRDLRRQPSWPAIRASGAVDVEIEVDGSVVTSRIELLFNFVRFGERPWLKCPCCGSRRSHLFLRDGHVGCRRCFNLLYREQAIPGCRWKREVAVPALRATRQKSSKRQRRRGKTSSRAHGIA